MRIAVIPGSFDPITIGHIDIIKRSSLLFDKVYVVVGENSNKVHFLTKEERVKTTSEALKEYKNVSVEYYSGLIVLFCQSIGAKYICKGIRDNNDFTYERELEINNCLISPEIETVYFSSNKDNQYIRSSTIREFIKYGISIEKFVPTSVYTLINNKEKSNSLLKK